MPAEVQQPILERAGGNPLYAEEFVRLLKDRDLLERAGSSWQLREGAEVPFPESVQALIAARLDTLEPDAKSLLADAAVIGKVFWAGAVTAMGDRDPTTVTAMLRELSRKELVRPARQSSMAGEAEYAFWHVLARDVAYNQLPRASRATRHVAAASWIESKATRAGRRPRRRARLPLRDRPRARPRCGPRPTRPPSWKHRRCASSGLAGERALGLDTAAALASFERALALTPPGHPERPAALGALRRGRRSTLDALVEAKDALEEAIDVPGRRRPAGRRRAMGPSLCVLPARGSARLGAARGGGRAARAPRARPRARRRSHRARPCREPARAPRGGIGYAEQALSLAGQLGLERPARALGFRGMARSNLGDPGGLDDFREAIVLATEAGQGREVAILHNNLALRAVGVRRPRRVPRGGARRGSRSPDRAASPRSSMCSPSACSRVWSTWVGTSRRSTLPPSWPTSSRRAATRPTSRQYAPPRP